MRFRIRSFIKRIIPASVVRILQLLLNILRTPERLRTRSIFAAASESPSYLDLDALKKLQERYPPLPEYGYDAETVEIRGRERSQQILRLPGTREALSFLELGCWDGMVSCCLCRKGKKATAIDNRDTGFDERASREGVELLQMNAANLQFTDESFDVVFSYDSFEHFDSPEDVLREAIRVVKVGGYVYLEFGPLYYSPFGEHAYRSITVPYCQFLFTQNTINDFATQQGLDTIDFSHVNRWSLEDYRTLWRKYSSMLKKIRYHESPNLSHLGLIRAYPSCFKSKSNYFENFIVANISVLFQKTDREFGLQLHSGAISRRLEGVC